LDWTPNFHFFREETISSSFFRISSAVPEEIANFRKFANPGMALALMTSRFAA